MSATAPTDDEIIHAAQKKADNLRAEAAARLLKQTPALPDLLPRRERCARCEAPLPPDRRWQCAECDELIEALKLEHEARDAEQRAEERLRRSQLPMAYVTGERTLGDVRDVGAIAVAKAMLAGAHRGLYVFGPAGPDKTTLLAASLAEWIRAGRSGLYVFVPDLIGDILTSYKSGSNIGRNDIVDPLIEADFLLLDDIDKINWSDHTAGVLMQVLDGRYRRLTARHCPVLGITANRSLASFISRFSEDETAKPIERRIAEMTAKLEMRL